MTLTYSAIWKAPNRIAEYSVWYPATSSASASGRSNGQAVRLGEGRDEEDEEAEGLEDDVPARDEAEHRFPAAWRSTSVSRKELDARITPAAAVVIASSYEMICALERIPPISENLLFEDQPASTIAYTESDVIAKM